MQVVRLLCVAAVLAVSTSWAQEQVRFTGNTTADEKLVHDAFQNIALYIREHLECSSIDRVEAEVLEPGSIQRSAGDPEGAAPAVYEQWTASFCDKKQAFLVVFWASKEGGTMYRVQLRPAAQKTVLILAPQGVDPAKDTVGFNTLARNVTQTFASALSARLAKRNFYAANVLDQNPKYDTGQKLAIHAVKNSATTAAVLTLETKGEGAATELQLMIQFVEGHITTQGDKPAGFMVDRRLEKRYVLRSSKGDNPMTMEQLAEDYVKFLEAQGKLADAKRFDLMKLVQLGSKGRVQDPEYAPKDPVIAAILDMGKDAIPLLIDALASERAYERPPAPLWSSMTEGDAALMVLTDLFLDPTWQQSTLPELCWDRILERKSPGISSDELIQDFVKAHGRGELSRRWRAAWSRVGPKVQWDTDGRFFKVAGKELVDCR